MRGKRKENRVDKRANKLSIEKEREEEFDKNAEQQAVIPVFQIHSQQGSKDDYNKEKNLFYHLRL